MNTYKFIKYYLLYTIFILCMVVVINFVIDPLYTFKHTSHGNIKHIDFDERVQKTNYLAYINNDFDAILLGNSRSTYIKTNNLKIGYKIFNYSVSAMEINEFEATIDNFISITNKEPKVIILGIDLFQLAQHNNNSRSIQIKEALKNIQDPFYQYRNLLSFDNLIFSLKNIKLSIKLKYHNYDRKQRFYDGNMVKGYAQQNLIPHTENIYEMKNTQFIPLDNSTIKQLEKLKLKYTHSKFIIFAPPIHASLYNEWMQNDHFMDAQKKGLRNLVNIFGEIYHFFYIHPLLESDLNFYDAFHFYPFLGEFITQKINNPSLQQNFGIILNKENIELYLNTLK